MKTLKWTIGELLDYLDGQGIIVTDDDLIRDALHEFGVDIKNKIIIEGKTEE